MRQQTSPARPADRPARAAKPCHTATAPTQAASPKRAARHNEWTLARQAEFLRHLSATHSVATAARNVGMSRQSAYRLRSKLAGQAFDLAWEVAFHHSYNVLAHAALDRALNGVEVPIFFQGEQVGSYRRFDERLTLALMRWSSTGGVPVMGRFGPAAERHARDFESLLASIENGEEVATGAPGAGDPSELEALRKACPSGLSDEELMAMLQGVEREGAR